MTIFCENTSDNTCPKMTGIIPITLMDTMDVVTPSVVLATNAVGRKPNPTKWILQAKKLFLTFPQCTTSAKECLSLIQAKFGGDLLFAVVSQEDHTDQNGQHLHCLISLSKKYRSKVSTDLDSLVNPPKHGDYQAVRVEKLVMKYVIKGGAYEAFGVDVPAYMIAAEKRQNTKGTIIAKR